MISTLLLDVDGVIVPVNYFPGKLKRDFGLTEEDTESFFKGVFRDCSVGKADVKEAISPFLLQWGWKKSVEEFLEYWFTSDSTVDQKVLDYVQDLRRRKIACYLATVQEKYRAEYLWEVMRLKEFFDGAFHSCHMGHLKENPKFFEYALRKLHQPPEIVLYFDDKQSCVESAKAVGIQARLYTGFPAFVEEVERATIR